LLDSCVLMYGSATKFSSIRLIVIKKSISISIFILLGLLATEKSWSASVKISGKAPEYATNSIELYILHDFITEEKVKLGTIRFNAEGVFNLEIEIAETNLCMADFDGYHGMIYFEPGKSYPIVFPPKRTLTESQKRNPFVKPEPVWFGISTSDKNELNFKIQQFEQEYAKLENKYFDRIFVNQSKSLVDTVKLKLDAEFPKTNLVLFESHKFFRRANLDFALNQGKSAEFMETYFSGIRPLYNLASYSVIFNQVFMDYFSVLTNVSNSIEIKNAINTANLSKLDELFQKKLNFNKELSHLVLLKSMNDAYYSKQFSKASILKLLYQVKSPEWSDYEQKTAQLISSKLTYLTSGTNPPSIALKNEKGQKVNFSDYPNTYIYLHFTDPKNSICRQHLDALKTIAARYKEKFVIINVIPENNSFKNDGGWSGVFATTESNIETSYKVKTYPNSFLIGKDGKLLLSPAPNPIDGLDRLLGQLFKSDYYKEMQKSSKQAIK
jgi:hypothetical protein